MDQKTAGRLGAVIFAAGLLAACTPTTQAADESLCRISGEGPPIPEPSVSVNATVAQMMDAQGRILSNYERCMKTAAWDFRNLDDGIEPVAKAVLSRCQTHADQWRFAELLLDNHKVSTSPESMDHLTHRSSHALGYVAEVRACLKSGTRPPTPSQ